MVSSFITLLIEPLTPSITLLSAPELSMEVFIGALKAE